MNPDDNNPSGTPAEPVVPAQTPEPAQPDLGGTPPVAPMGGEPTQAENCHCGKPSVGGSCTGCNLPNANCTCAPATV